MAAAPLSTHPAEGLALVPAVWMVSFFVVMLLAIAVLPLSPWKHAWEKNRNKLLVSLVLAAYPVFFYILHEPHTLLETLLHEYVPFIILLGALFVIAGGIRVTGDMPATPAVNVAFLGIGSLLASLIGTTGASMLLIRPLLQTNQERQYRAHTVIFFIFLVSNIGGSLLPVGDPPLFLGYLQGVPFFWTLRLWRLWLPAVGIVLTVYYVLDRAYFTRETTFRRTLDRASVEPLRVAGGLNLLWLFGVMAAVIVAHDRSPIPLLRVTYMREVLMFLMVGLALFTSSRQNWRNNKFTMGPITEVAVLFLGIFMTMVPALALLRARGSELGINTPAEFFWASGSLSSFLDNAPTYLVFFKTAAGAVASGAVSATHLVGGGVDRVPEHLLLAISAGSVFMGANTYIGNGPNFMVKSIAEEAGVRMPSFFGYMRWSGLVLIPTFLLITVLFFLGHHL